jgi:hypothetical protein
LRSRSRAVPTIFVVTCAALTAGAFANYELRGLARHPEDIKLFKLDHAHGSFRRLILSDSVTENATAGVVIDATDLPLLTHGWMRLAGQYFLMRRALENNTIEAVDLFLVPDLLLANVDNEAQGRIRHTYTDTLFMRRDEIDDLRRAGDEEAGRQFVFFELLFKSLQPAPRDLPLRTMTHVAAARPSDTEATNEESRLRLEGRIRALSDFSVTAQNRVFLKEFAETCARRAVSCRMIIEPMPASLPRMNSSLLRDLAPGVEVIDINDFTRFPDSAFRDGLHLRSPKWAAYYRTILSEKGLMKFGSYVPKEVPWNGEAIAFDAGHNDDRLVRVSGFHAPEPWGCWTDGMRAEVFVNIGSGAAHRRHLTFALTALVKKGPQRVAVSINGEERCSQMLTESGAAILSCDLPDGAEGPTKIEISASYASSPRDWGADDSRALGIGLRSMTLE